MRALFKFLIPWTGVSVLLFLLFSGFLSSWDGHAISVRPPPVDVYNPSTYRVLILESDGWHEQDWPADAIEGLDLPFDSTGVPPPIELDDRPSTRKSRFQLQFFVQNPDGGLRTIGTTSPRSLGLALITFFLGIGIRNMVYAGSPFSLTQAKVYLPPAQVPAGTASQPNPQTTSRPRKGPPPPKRRRGRGR